MGIWHVHPDCDDQKFCLDDNLPARVSHLHLVQAVAFIGGGLGVVPNPYHAWKFGTGYYPCCGLFIYELGSVILVGGKQHTGDGIG